MIKPESFYPKYPYITVPDDKLDTYPGIKFNDAIVTKKEFRDLKLARVEPVPTKPGEYLLHQQYIAEFLSIKTGYDELLLFHEPGTGKTCTAIATIEGLKATKRFKGAVICAKGDGLLANFRQELVFTCTDGRYIPEGYDTLTDLQRTHRINKNTSDFYSFITFEMFAKELTDLSDNTIIDRYNDHVFVIDEVHHLRAHDEDDIDDDPEQPSAVVKSRDAYAQIYRLFHLVPRRKILLMSGTPIKDTADEFARVMNLILPTSDQFVTDRSFINRYFSQSDDTVLINKAEFAQKIRGRVSYLNAAKSDVVKRLIGRRLGKLKHFVVSQDTMSPFQSAAYERSYADDVRSKSIFINSRQASLLVFPDSSVGQDGFRKYVTIKRVTVPFKTQSTAITRYEFTSDMRKAISSIESLRMLSSKYAFVVETILSKVNEKHFVYCQYVNGSGAIAFSLILRAFGYQEATGRETTKGKRYALLTRQTSSSKVLQRLVNRYNSDDNLDGDYISIVIGSRVLNEGFTLKNVKNEFILTGHWNYAETAQAIARGWRLGSHTALIDRGDKNVSVSVYQQVSMPLSSTPSIDLELYETAERKDIINRQIERLVKETAFDCPLTVARNKTLGYDGQRECDYTNCEYNCDGSMAQIVDKSTYSIVDTIKRVDEHLKSIFRRSHTRFYDIANLADTFPDIDDRELVRVLQELVLADELYTDRFGMKRFLRFHGTLLFLSSDPKTDDGALSEYYTRNLVLESVDSFDNVLEEAYDDALPRLVEQLFDNADMMRSLVVRLPHVVQREVLSACVIARYISNRSKNTQVRDDILMFYEGFYGQKPVSGQLVWVVWLYADSLNGTICYDKRHQKFVPCTVNLNLAAIRSPIGYMGLFNPTSKDFCLRNTDVEETRDLRRVTVGRRCQNYEFETLLDIIARRMKIEPEEQNFYEHESRAELITILSKFVRYGAIKVTDDDDRDDIRRLIYWASRTKDQMCVKMQSWFGSNRLLETNFDCGSQKKSRSKFMKQ